MTAQKRGEAFFKALNELRGRATWPEAPEIVRLALKSGLTRQEALLELRRCGPFSHLAAGPANEALPAFIAGLFARSGAHRTLQYLTATTLLTAYIPEESSDQQITFASPDPSVGETLRALEPTSVVFAAAENQKSEYDLIVCQPLLGHGPAGHETADGFGGDVVREFAPSLAESGTLYWVTGRGALRAPRTIDALQAEGLNVVAVIDLAPGTLAGTTIAGLMIALRRDVPAKKLVGTIRDEETAQTAVSAALAGPSRKVGPTWVWLDPSDARTFGDIERERLLVELTPRGRHKMIALGSLLESQDVVKADRPVADENATAAFLFIPEYAVSHVTADLETQTVKPKAVYRFAIDPARANPRFLAQLLNSPYGRHLRESAARGATIRRTSVASLLAMELPIPDIATQDRIARIDNDLGLLRASFHEMRAALDRDWTGLTDIGESIDKLKAVLDIERQIADWWRELPYPLATIYRRYQVSTDPKERLETLLHFFEMSAVYLAAVGTSHVRVMRQNWQDVMAKWLHPPATAGIERADFGFWIGLAGASLKDTSRIGSDKNLRAAAIETAGPELVQASAIIGSLGKATETLDVARRYRNSWIGHSGHVKPSDAARLVGELQQAVRDLYKTTSSVFRRLQLVRPGLAEATDTGLRFQIEKLSGSDPTFDRLHVELDRPAKTRSLAFWMVGARTMCRALPFFRLGAPQQPQETSFYVFSRVENGGCRWISYQEAREQEFVAPDDELLGLIALKEGPA